MVIEKVHGLRATSISMHERFTILAMTAPILDVPKQPQNRRRNSMGSYTQNFNYNNRMSAQQLARRWSMQAKRAVKQRLGTPQSGVRRYGSDGNLQRLQRANSFGNLSQSSVKSRVSWRQSHGNLSRSASFSDLTSVGWRNFRKRGGGYRQLRGRYRSRGRGGINGIGRNNNASYSMHQQQYRGPKRQTARRSRGWLKRRGGVNRKETKPTLSKEELDLQLDQYMAGTKAALDLELDNYMKNVMEVE